MPIDTISGPFCEELIDTYIAHETDAPGFSVPIIQDTDEQVLIPEDAVFGAYATECFEGEEICCNPYTEIKFIDALETVIPYGPTLVGKHGLTPTVNIFYYEEDGDNNNFFRIDSTLTRVSMIGNPTTQVKITHGGPSTGIVKLQ